MFFLIYNKEKSFFMEENLDINNEVNNEISDNTTKSNSEEIKVPKSEKVILKIWKMILYLKIMRKILNKELRSRHKGILEKLNQQFLLITEYQKYE